MRASRLNEHKLVLQDFLLSTTGQRLRDAAAAALGISRDELMRAVERLPRLDFYAPFQEHRRRWRGGADILVALTYDLQAPTLTAFRTTGERVLLHEADGVPRSAVLVLHPAEPKVLRDNPQPDRPGDVIEDANDGQIGTRRMFAAEDPASWLGAPPFAAAPALVACEVDCGGGPGGPPPAPLAPGLYVDQFVVNEDDGFGGGTMEIRIDGEIGGLPISWAPRRLIFSSGPCDQQNFVTAGVREGRSYNPNFLLTPEPAASVFLSACQGRPGTYAVTLWEDDGGSNSFNGNDHYGTRVYSPGPFPAGAVIGVSQEHRRNNVDDPTGTVRIVRRQ